MGEVGGRRRRERDVGKEGGEEGGIDEKERKLKRGSGKERMEW